MSELSDDEGAEITKAAARRLGEVFVKQQDYLLSEHSAMARWLTASLLILNGGATLAIFNAAEKLHNTFMAASLFIGGIFAALLIGVLNQQANRKGGAILGEAIGQTFVVAHTGEYTAEAQMVAENIDARMAKAGRWPAKAGWLSALLFLAGAAVTAWDVPAASPRLDRQCRWLQKDMLQSKPRRADSRELFEALQCRAR